MEDGQQQGLQLVLMHCQWLMSGVQLCSPPFVPELCQPLTQRAVSAAGHSQRPHERLRHCRHHADHPGCHGGEAQGKGSC